MLRVQFNNQKSMYQVNFKKVSPGTIQLTGEKVPQNTSGFKIYRMNGEFLGDYSDYTKITGEVKKGLLYSKGVSQDD